VKSSIRTFILLLAIASFPACSKKPNLKPLPKVTWPTLSEFAFISDRAATTEDVSEGRAVFVLQDAGKPIGEPIGIPVPQYAIHRDKETGTQTPCVIIQAEQARGQRLIGASMLPHRSIMAGFLQEFELLGTTPPSTSK